MASEAAHYDAVAQHYGEADFYKRGPYRDWQLAVIRAALRLEPGARLADVGGGDGAFGLDCVRAASRAGPSRSPSRRRRLGAGRGRARCSRLLLKEVVHHPAARAAFFADARANRLAAGGRALVVTRPRVDIDYPFWDAARDVWAAHQPSEADLADELRAAGFSAVDVSVEAYAMEMPLERWLDLVAARFWSTFAHFDDAALAAGIADVRARATPDAAGAIRFEERLVLIDAQV
ncbi:hypothetical protein SO694_00117093 [Aureococcus anophagefferens]|uniref:Methyltransferase domain-containing protein n=1 Tax=Aureococcus anophagefferens TaxID=44056 RepID=A0ABR1FWK9_AURAN